MSKEKKLRKIVLDKLYYKQQNQMKKSTRSNAPTQATPNEPKTLFKAIEKFFENFQTECAIIHQPVRMNDRKPLKRSLQQQLTCLYKSDKKIRFKTQQNPSFDVTSKHTGTEEENQFRKRYQSFSRINTQISQNKSKQRSKINTHEINQIMFKNKMTISNVVSPNTSTILSKQNSNENFSYQSKQQSPCTKIEKNKMLRQKSYTLIEKQSQKYVASSKYIITRNNLNIFKNAPKKPLEKQNGAQKIKRIQSLKNLNENAIRKYSYKREN